MNPILHKWAQYRSRWLTINKVNRWTRNASVFKLQFALIYGDYKLRCAAIAGLQKHQDQSSIPLLNDAVEDSVSLVSLSAMQALETLGHEQPHYFDKKRAFWSKKTKQEEDMLRNQRNRRIRRKKERSSSESYNDHKERAKKPVNTKFWM